MTELAMWKVIFLQLPNKLDSFGAEENKLFPVAFRETFNFEYV